jgi:predicted DNA-binding transcriptional regulator AlpA
MQAQKTSQPEPLLSVSQLAKYLGVPKSWVYNQSRLKKHTGFPVKKFGKYLRFCLSEVLEWERTRGE